MLFQLILILVRKKNVKKFYSSLEYLIYTDKKLHGAFYDNSNIKNLIVKICPEYLYDTSIEEILQPNGAFKLARFI